MGTKHDVLTEEELATYQIDPLVRRTVEELLVMNPTWARRGVNVLDWGCGRGRSVAKLREEGFNAFGVDVDERAMRNGHHLFEQRGLDPCALLLKVDETSRFGDAFFHLIFSEQVLEHVKDLSVVLEELARLTAPGGLGIHIFPASKNIVEEHLFMPLVHWLPKNAGRKAAIALLMALGYGPEPPWVETHGHGFWFTVETYYRYLNDRTYYRDILDVCSMAAAAGFSARYDLSRPFPWNTRLLSYISRNGFPRASVTLRLTRLTTSPAAPRGAVV